MGTDFSFDFYRTVATGIAEAAITTTDDARVWDLSDWEDQPNHEQTDALVLLTVGFNFDFEVNVWDATITPGGWRAVGTGTLVSGTPLVIPFVYHGARVFIRKTSVTAGATVLFLKQHTLGVALLSGAPLPLPVGASTSALQVTGNASLTSIDGKITACNTGAVTVAASALPAGASTSALQTTGNASLVSIDGKITACNTGAVTVAASALPTLASTSTLQTTGNNSLSSIDGKITACNTGSVTVAASALPTLASTSTLQTTGNNSLSSIDGKITACNTGSVTVAASALPTGAAVSATQGQNIATDVALTTIHTWAAAVADAEPPASGLFIALGTPAGYSGYLELHLLITALAGTVAATQVTFKVWNRMGGVAGTIKKVDEFTCDAARLVLGITTNPYTPRVIRCNSGFVYVTATFLDGTVPTITGDALARPVSMAGIQRSDFAYNPVTGHVIVENRGYDSVTDAIKNSPTIFETDLALEEPLVVSTTALTAGTEYYYPSADGALMMGYDSVAFEWLAQAGAGGSDTITVWFETTIGSNAWAQRNVITLAGSDLILGTRYAATPITSAATGTISGVAQFDNLNTTRVRMVVKPITGNSRTVTLSLRRKVRGS